VNKSSNHSVKMIFTSEGKTETDEETRSNEHADRLSSSLENGRDAHDRGTNED